MLFRSRDTIKCLRDPETDAITCESCRMAQIAALYYENIQFDGHDPLRLMNNHKMGECLSLLWTRLMSEAKQKLTEQMLEGEI